MHTTGLAAHILFFLIPAVLAIVDDGSRCVNNCQSDKSPPHGYCSGTIISACQCIEQYENDAWDCSERACPKHTSWFDMPDETSGIAHGTTTACSSKGKCQYSSGLCLCDNDYEGQACERLRCPGTFNGTTCSGHGKCLTMREAGLHRNELTGLADVDYSAWDADKIQGCVCDAGWTGPDCNTRQCPMGSDPLDLGNVEVQSVYTSDTARVEIQQINITGLDAGPGIGDVDAVQRIALNGNVIGPLPLGTITLTFDSTAAASPKCMLCIVSAAATTSTITIGAVDTVNAAAVQAALEALSNIGVGGVTVTAAVIGFDHMIDVTFTGANVGGDVTLLSMVTSMSNLASSNIAETLVGSEVAGAITLLFDDSGNVPTRASLQAADDYVDDIVLAPRGVQTQDILYSSSIATIATAIEALTIGALESVVNPITVQRIGTGGPGVSWKVTFSGPAKRLRGNLAEMTAISSITTPLTLTHASLTTPTAAVAVITLQQGIFMSGSFTLTLPYVDANGQNAVTTASASLAWNAPAATVQAALNALDLGYGLGQVAVSRARYYTNTTYDWAGSYLWKITFASADTDIPLLATPDASSLGGLMPAIAATAVTEGDATAQINPTILIDCKCADCSAPATQGFKLRLGSTTTAFIAYSASAATVASALAAIPGVGTPLVVIYDYVSSTTAAACDADGSTIAITFKRFESASATPTLKIVTSTLPASAVYAVVSSGWGKYGGKAHANTRKSYECSNQGLCDRTTGTCSCLYVSGIIGFDASNNEGGTIAVPAAADTTLGVANCGYPLATVSACPTDSAFVQCSGHGTCSGSPLYHCVCTAGWSGPTCSVATCPSGTSWFDVPTSSTTAHTTQSTCSNRGVCSTGICTCDGLFRGTSCSLMGCPADGTRAATQALAIGDSCYAGNPCVTLNNASQSYRYTDSELRRVDGPVYTAWDATMIRGCVCNKTRVFAGTTAYSQVKHQGYACTEYSCPLSEDPQTPESFQRQFEVQEVTCYAGAGKVGFRFRNVTSYHTPYTAYVTEQYAPWSFKLGAYKTAEKVLMNLNITGKLIVSNSEDGQLCNSSGRTFRVTFASLPAPIPLLEMYGDADAAANISAVGVVTRITTGNIGSYSCSRRGVCDRTNGRCACSKQFGTSDGMAYTGELGDCGNRDALFGLRYETATILV